MNFLRWLWANHIQKTLGYLEAAIGTLEYIDQTTINVIGNALGPKWGPIVSRAIQVSAGLMVAIRAQQRRQNDGHS